ncbi:MAG TPA: thioredoxin family protein [Flavobacteriaceae bacterium]|nr:thioredoxin family protein [Flavobacteriaceae bacterium]
MNFKFQHKMANKLALRLILCVLIIGCEKQETRVEVGIKEEVLNKKLPIILYGKSLDTMALESFNIYNSSYSFGRAHKYLRREKMKDSTKIILDSIQYPLLMELQAFGSENKFYNSHIYVSPGDTLYFNIEKDRISFMGNNAPINNYFSEVYSNDTFDYGRNPYQGDIWDYKSKVKGLYDLRLDLLNKYVEKYNMPTAHIETINYHLKFEYLNNLISPRSKPLGIEGMYVNDFEGLKNIVETEYIYKEGIFDLGAYLDNTELQEFIESGFLANHYYKNSLTPMIRYYFETSNATPFTTEKFLAEKEFIQNNLEGKMENYAIARMIWDYNLHGFGYSERDANLMKSLITEYEAKYKDSTFLEVMEKIKEDLNLFSFKFNESALNTKLVNKVGDTITLNKLFSRSNKKIRVLDFWASWCGPCIADITESKAFKDRLSVEKNVEWIYISIDAENDKWIKKANELNDFFGTNDQYFIPRAENSALINYLKVKAIPRYVILDRENKIISGNAPNPSNSGLFERIINEIE